MDERESKRRFVSISISNKVDAFLLKICPKSSHKLHNLEREVILFLQTWSTAIEALKTTRGLNLNIWTICGIPCSNKGSPLVSTLLQESCSTC